MTTVDECLLEDGEVDSFDLSRDASLDASTPHKRSAKSNTESDSETVKLLKIFSSSKRLRTDRSGYRPLSHRIGYKSSSRKRKCRYSMDREPASSPILFSQMPIRKDIRSSFTSLHMSRANNLQKRILPTLLTNKRKNFFVQSKPHSGKKTAYLITALQRIDQSINRTQVIILAPTSELVTNIACLAKRLARQTEITIDYMIRDSGLSQPFNDHLLVVTMGTLLILLNEPHLLDTRRVSLLMFDEVEIMHSGEENGQKMARIASLLAGCQQVFFSTSFNRSSQEFVQTKITSKLIKLSVACPEDFMNNVLQFHVDCTGRQWRERKYHSLVRVLEHSIGDKTLVFVVGKETAEGLCHRLVNDGFDAMCLSSKSSTDERLAAFRHYKASQRKILIINYPMCQGMDFGAHVQVIVNYDMPIKMVNLEYEYFHRISKCGRRSKPGLVVNLIEDRTLSVHKMLEHLYDIRLIQLIT